VKHDGEGMPLHLNLDLARRPSGLSAGQGTEQPAQAQRPLLDPELAPEQPR
jgi:hypothetical protein